MPSGIKLSKLISKELLEQTYLKEKSVSGTARVLKADPEAIKKLMNTYGIVFKYKCKYEHNDDFFAGESEKIYYWAGFLAADGCIKEKNKNTKILAVGLANKDLDHIELFKKDLNAQEPIKHYENSSTIHITSIKICKDLAIFNIVPRKTKIYTFPEINQKLVHHFMRGYFDGDGCFYKYKSGQLTFSLRGTKEFIEEFQKILIEKCGLNKTKLYYDKTWVVQYCGNVSVSKIAKFLYKDATTLLNRKYNIISGII